MRNVVLGLVVFCASACALFCLCFILANTVSAQVVLNEISPAPTTGNEWIELLNIGTGSASLAGWSLEDELTTPSVLATLPANSTLLAGEYRVVEVVNKLNNSGDGVRLFNAQHSLQDYFAFASSSAGLSYGRLPNGTGSWQLVQTPSSGSANIANPTLTPAPIPSATPTPSGSSPFDSPTPTPTAALDPTFQPPQFSEIMACPASGQTEWVEFFNPNLQPLTLTNWKIVDAGNHIRIFTLALAAQKYASVTIDPALLNNTGDQILLQSPDGVTVDQFQYASCVSGQSWELIDEDWQQSDPSQNEAPAAQEAFSADENATNSANISAGTAFTGQTTDTTALQSGVSLAKQWLRKYEWPAPQSNPKTAEETTPFLQATSSEPEPVQQTPPFPFSSPAYKPILYASVLFNTLLTISQLPAAWRWYTEFREQQRIRADPFGVG